MKTWIYIYTYSYIEILSDIVSSLLMYIHIYLYLLNWSLINRYIYITQWIYIKWVTDIYIYTYGDIWFVGRSTLTLGMFFVSLEDISFSTRGGRGFLLSSIIWSHKSSSGERLQGLGPGTGLFQLLLKCENHLGEFSGQKLAVNIAILPLYSGCWEQACVLPVNSQRHGQKLDSEKKHIGVFIYIYTYIIHT